MNLKIEDGSFGYTPDKLLYTNINFEINSGETMAVLGVNGSGKTTLLKCILGLLKWNTGSTLIDGTPLDQISNKEFWRRVSYVPQVKGVAPSLSVEEMVLLGRSPYISSLSQPKKVDYKLVDEVLELLGLKKLKGRMCSELSGGELQMVLIGRALVSDPELIVLDEPESNLDFKNQLKVLEILKFLSKEKNIMCLINTHYPEHALKIADKTLMIDKKNGNSITGPSKDVISKNNLEDFFNVNVLVDSVMDNEVEHKVIIPLSII